MWCWANGPVQSDGCTVRWDAGQVPALATAAHGRGQQLSEEEAVGNQGKTFTSLPGSGHPRGAPQVDF